MSTGRTKAQTVQVRIFSTQTEARKKVHISQLYLKFHMLSFPVSVKSFYLKNQRENDMSTRGTKCKKFLLSHTETLNRYINKGNRIWKHNFFFFRLNRQNPGNFPHLTDLSKTSNGLFLPYYSKKINENRTREQGGIEVNRINLIVSVQTRKTQGISIKPRYPQKIFFF